MYVILVVDVKGLKDQVVFEKHLKKEGFKAIPDEPFVYEGDTTTHLFSTRAFILEVVLKGLEKSGFVDCKIMFQVGNNPLEAYQFDTLRNEFIALRV